MLDAITTKVNSLDSGEENIRILEIKIDKIDAKVQEMTVNNCESGIERENSLTDSEVCENQLNLPIYTILDHQVSNVKFV